MRRILVAVAVLGCATVAVVADPPLGCMAPLAPCSFECSPMETTSYDFDPCNYCKACDENCNFFQHYWYTQDNHYTKSCDGTPVCTGCGPEGWKGTCCLTGDDDCCVPGP